MFYWIYDIPTWQLGLLFAMLFVGTTWIGVLFVSPILKFWLKSQAGINDLVGYSLSAFGVFYGLLLGLLAVATYQNSSKVDSTVGREAASVAALFRDASAYPEPIRSDLRDRLRDYTRFVIDKAWPAQRLGQVPQGSVKMMDDFQRVLTQFEPATKGQELLHGEALRQYNEIILLRCQRIQSIGTGIPGFVWYMVAAWVVIFLIATMGHPFRGEVRERTMISLRAGEGFFDFQTKVSGPGKVMLQTPGPVEEVTLSKDSPNRGCLVTDGKQVLARTAAARDTARFPGWLPWSRNTTGENMLRVSAGEVRLLLCTTPYWRFLAAQPQSAIPPGAAL